MRKKEVFVGIDVAKEELEVAVFPRAETETWPNTEEGLVLLVEWLKPLRPAILRNAPILSDRFSGASHPLHRRLVSG